MSVELPPHIDETALAEAARRRDVGVYALRDYRVDATATNTGASPALVLGYAALTEASIAEGVRLLAAAIRDTAPA